MFQLKDSQLLKEDCKGVHPYTLLSQIDLGRPLKYLVLITSKV